MQGICPSNRRFSTWKYTRRNQGPPRLPVDAALVSGASLCGIANDWKTFQHP